VRNIRRPVVSVIVVTVLAALASAMPVAASASTKGSPAGQAKSEFQRRGMTIVMPVKILGAVPDKPGYMTVLDANGDKAIVPNYLRSHVDDRIHQRLLHPLLYDESVGDCGSSFINITTKPDGFMIFRSTGWSVILPGVYYSWRYGVQGPGYPAKTFNFSGSLLFDTSWSNDVASAYDYANGTWAGAVSSVLSYVDLADGSTCWSGGPAVTGYV
jgi:hypothetical protein